MMDLFYTKFVIFLNQYKSECQRLGRDPDDHGATITSTLSHWRPMVTLLENAILSLKKSPKSADQLELNKCQAVYSCFQEVYENCVQDSSKIFVYMNEFLQVFSFQDTNFIARSLVKSANQMKQEQDRDKENREIIAKLMHVEEKNVAEISPELLAVASFNNWRANFEELTSRYTEEDLDCPSDISEDSLSTNGFTDLDQLSDLLLADEDFLLQMPSDVFESLIGGRKY